MAVDLHQSERQGHRRDPWQSRDDRCLPGRHSRQRQACLRRSQDGQGPVANEFFPNVTVPGNQLNVDFMVKDSKRFADSGGWGYAVFDYNAESNTFTPGTASGTPPQGNDAKCGFACHTRAKTTDYVFTVYGKR